MNPFPTDDIVSRFKMFWQYPVITEKTFYEQNKNNNNCLSFPWATVIDKNYRNDVIYNILKKYIHPGRQYYTCCQHISFRNLIPLFKSLGIQTVYTPHKMIGENVLSDIQLRPCPLYAVNVEDPHRNTTFKNVELLNVERKLLYSFQGAYIPRIYLTDIREKIFNMKHPDKCFVHNTGQWHFERIVYNKLQNKDYMLSENDSDKERTEKYNRLLLESRYSLCPSGSGPNSIRFWESLACGSIPVLLSDGLELPSHELWDESIVRVSERELHTLPMLLSNIDTEKENRMRENCIKLYEYYTTNYANRKSKNMIVFGNCHDAKTEQLVISLGSSCDAGIQLKRIGVNHIHYFFDFIWNEYDGLKTVNEIIRSDFSHFNNIENYTKTTSHPILNWAPFNINKYYPNFVFMHHDTTKPQIIESVNRKIDRTQAILSNPAKKIFIYYRHYHWSFNLCSDLDVLINESLEFCEMYKNKYNTKNFYLLSLIVYDPKIDKDKINTELCTLRNNENENLKFDFLYRRNDNDNQLNTLFIKSWDNVFKKYNIQM